MNNLIKTYKIKIHKLLNNIISFNFKRTYSVIKVSDNEFILVKILNKYTNKKEADTDMIKLITNDKLEYDILKRYNE
jgi:formyltetrahydrofolate hydrolase